MELARVEALLETYFDGNTNLEQEALLHEYFADIDPTLEKYKPIFVGFRLAREEVSTVNIKLPQTRKRNRGMWYGVAASAVITLTVAGYMFMQPSLTSEEKEALAKYQEAQSTMLLLSENLNKGTAVLTHLNAFSQGQEQITVLNEFTKSKNIILK